MSSDEMSNPFQMPRRLVRGPLDPPCRRRDSTSFRTSSCCFCERSKVFSAIWSHVAIGKLQPNRLYRQLTLQAWIEAHEAPVQRSDRSSAPCGTMTPGAPTPFREEVKHGKGIIRLATRQRVR